MSGVASNRARIRSLEASIRPDLRSPPTDRARASPCSRSSARHRLTLAALTPKRSLARRWLKPPATAARTRTRRSNDKAVGMPAGLHPGQQLDGVDGPRPSGIAVCQHRGVEVPSREGSAPMQVTTIGLDIAKNVFQLHGIDAEG